MADERAGGDGCSGAMSWAWRRLTGRAPPWEGCCVEHDAAYRAGGAADLRLAADRELRACVARRGYPAIAAAMYYGVRLAGGAGAPPLHRLVSWAPRLGLAESVPDYRWGKVPALSETALALRAWRTKAYIDFGVDNDDVVAARRVFAKRVADWRAAIRENRPTGYPPAGLPLCGPDGCLLEPDASFLAALQFVSAKPMLSDRLRFATELFGSVAGARLAPALGPKITFKEGGDV